MDHHSTTLEVEGKISNTYVSILIDSRASLIYISPKMVEKCKLVKEKQKNSWLVQLDTWVKGKVTEIVKNCRLTLNDMDTLVNIHIFPLGYYDILIGMDWMESHNAIIDCLHKSLGCRDEEGKYYTVKGIYKPISIGQILAVQLKKCIRRGCQIYAIKIREMAPKNSTSVLEQFPILKEF